jgi:protein ImuA
MAAAVQPAFASLAERSPAARIDRLRQTLCATEAATSLAVEDSLPLTFGVPAIDTVLGGGLAGGALHEIAAARESELPAATGFALALTTRAPSLPSPASARSRASSDALCGGGLGWGLWIAEDLSLAENGALYGPGLAQAGIAPERLITVAAARGHDVLWAMEEALRCRAVAVVIGELRAPAIDQVASRRLSLAAHRAGRYALSRRDALDHRHCTVRRGAFDAARRAARAQSSWSSRSMDRGVEQCGAAFRARNGS